LRPQKCVLTVVVLPPKKKHCIADEKECEPQGEKEGGDGDKGQHGQDGGQEYGQGQCGTHERGQHGGRGRVGGRGQRGGQRQRGCQGQRGGRERGGGRGQRGDKARPTGWKAIDQKDSARKWMTFAKLREPGLIYQVMQVMMCVHSLYLSSSLMIGL